MPQVLTTSRSLLKRLRRCSLLRPFVVLMFEFVVSVMLRIIVGKLQGFAVHRLSFMVKGTWG